MNTRQLPGSTAARHGTGDADLSVMIGLHDAFRRDLVRLARVSATADLSDPARRQSVAAGWNVFKRQLHNHHTGEDEIIWPLLRTRLTDSQNALSVLAAMEDEHKLIDPVLAAVDNSFAAGGDGLADATDALATTLTGHLKHEEADCMPLIGIALTAAEWRRAGRKMGTKAGISTVQEMFAWMLDDVPRSKAAATLGELPPPVRLLYRRLWKPRYDKTSRW